MSEGYCMFCKSMEGGHFEDCPKAVPPAPTLEEIQKSWALSSGQPQAVVKDPPTWRELWDENKTLREENAALQHKLLNPVGRL